ncbi:MAG: tRNA pseudouridine(55) synthase TruB [Dehalococcoidia bacterium]
MERLTPQNLEGSNASIEALQGPVAGFLNIDKPAGITSFDVVRRVRRAARTRKVGHAGTLDPLATGVLPIALGDATRLVSELVDARKRYLATVRLGEETDTYDADGEVTSRADASHLDAATIGNALAEFEGASMQVPPAYSAIKRDGEPAYRAARRGDPHDLEARPVLVHSIALLEARPVGSAVDAAIEVECAKGFYVRSLAHDLGDALGVGGHVAALRRTAVGAFEARDAVPLDIAERALEAGRADLVIQATDTVIRGWPALVIDRASMVEVRHGRPVRPAVASVVRAGDPDERARCYGPDGRLEALLRRGDVPGEWLPFRVFTHETRSQ